MPTDQEILELKQELKERLDLVNSDPEYEGANPTAGDQWMLFAIGIIVPALLMALGWVLYA